MRKVIVNSTPLIILYKIGHLDILQKLYQDIFIPTAVYQEATGTLGILLRAKQQGIVDTVSPLLSEMKQHGFYIDSRLESLVLEQAKELLC